MGYNTLKKIVLQMTMKETRSKKGKLCFPHAACMPPFAPVSKGLLGEGQQCWGRGAGDSAHPGSRQRPGPRLCRGQTEGLPRDAPPMGPGIAHVAPCTSQQRVRRRHPGILGRQAGPEVTRSETVGLSPEDRGHKAKGHQ